MWARSRDLRICVLEKLTSMSTIPEFSDDFEELRARASSGGTLYGLMKRQALSQQPCHGAIPEEDSGGSPPPSTHRERSHSLIPQSVALPEEKGILKMLCEYTHAKRPPDNRPRRYSAACVDARDVTRRPLSPHRLIPPSPQYSGRSSPTHGEHDSRHRNRRSSLQTRPAEPDEISSQLSPTSAVCRRRSFSLTPKGNIINEGDDLVQVPLPSLLPLDVTFGSTSSDINNPGTSVGDHSRASSVNSTGSAYDSSDSYADQKIYRVIMLGGPGVGKTALTQQFLTSECMTAQNTSFDDGVECTIPVLLDGQESVLDLIDLPYSGDNEQWQSYDVQAYVIVYSITDRRSFRKAVELLYQVMYTKKETEAVILVANKTDLERSRIVSRQEGKSEAETHGAKYTEVSAILNHKVDDLLVGILKQIRLMKDPSTRPRRASKVELNDRQDSGGSAACCMTKNSSKNSSKNSQKKPSKKGLSLKRMFFKSNKLQGLFKSKSCENLFAS